jgi:hypothetical protein
MASNDREVINLPAGTLERWDRQVNEQAIPNTDRNRVTFIGAGRPATREEILEYFAQPDPEDARQHPHE